MRSFSPQLWCSRSPYVERNLTILDDKYRVVLVQRGCCTSHRRAPWMKEISPHSLAPPPNIPDVILWELSSPRPAEDCKYGENTRVYGSCNIQLGTPAREMRLRASRSVYQMTKRSHHTCGNLPGVILARKWQRQKSSTLYNHILQAAWTREAAVGRQWQLMRARPSAENSNGTNNASTLETCCQLHFQYVLNLIFTTSLTRSQVDTLPSRDP